MAVTAATMMAGCWGGGGWGCFAGRKVAPATEGELQSKRGSASRSAASVSMSSLATTERWRRQRQRSSRFGRGQAKGEELEQERLVALLREAEAGDGAALERLRAVQAQCKDGARVIPLHAAVALGLDGVTQALLAPGSSGSSGGGLRPDVKDRALWTPLYHAAHNGRERAIELLLAVGADVNARPDCGRTPLHAAAMHGNVRAVELLLAAGANPNLSDRDSRAPLHVAAELQSPGNDSRVVELLLAAGADATAKGDRQRTPLHMASGRGNERTIELLLTAGADVNAKDFYQRTPLHCAAGHGQAKATARLLEAGANPAAEDVNQRTPLHLAAENGDEETIQTLLKVGKAVDPKARDCDQRSPLHMASGHGCERAVELLLAAGADCRARDMNQRIALHYAAGKGKEGVVRRLLAAHSDPKSRDIQQRTPLHCSFSYNRTLNRRVAALLIQHGANPFLINQFGNATLDLVNCREDFDYLLQEYNYSLRAPFVRFLNALGPLRVAEHPPRQGHETVIERALWAQDHLFSRAILGWIGEWAEAPEFDGP